MAVTEQKLQPKGQPQLVMIGVTPRCSDEPAMSVRSGTGSVSRSRHGSRSSLWTASPSRVNERPAMVSSVAPALQRVDQLEHEGVAALAARDVVGVRERFVGHERDVRAADDGRHAVLADPLGDLVAGRRGRRGRGDAHEVRREQVVPVDGRELRAVDDDVVAGGLQAGADQRQAEARQERVGPHVQVGGGGFDQADLHAGSLSRGEGRRVAGAARRPCGTNGAVVRG